MVYRAYIIDVNEKLIPINMGGMPMQGTGFGLGVSVRRSLSESGEIGSIGTFGWGGFWYTTFFVDPQEQMVGVCMAQLYPSGKANLNARFSALARQAVID